MQVRMPPELAQQVIQEARPDVTLLMCMDEEFYTARATDHAAAFVGKYAADHLHVVDQLTDWVGRGPQKLVFVNDPGLNQPALGKS